MNLKVQFNTTVHQPHNEFAKEFKKEILFTKTIWIEEQSIGILFFNLKVTSLIHSVFFYLSIATSI